MIVEHLHCHNYDEVESTQTTAKEELKAGAIGHGHVISAAYQSNGYGRQNRKWLHKYGNIAISIVINPEIDPVCIPQLTYVAGLATLFTILHFKPEANAKLKWVNDVLIDGKKIAGTICELVNNEYAIVGIGVNLESNDDIKEVGGASLADFGIQVKQEEFIQKLLENFKEGYNQWRNYGFNPVKNLWCKYSHKEGETLTVKLPGDRVLVGKFVNISDDGKLILDLDGRPYTLPAGEV